MATKEGLFINQDMETQTNKNEGFLAMKNIDLKQDIVVLKGMVSNLYELLEEGQLPTHPKRPKTPRFVGVYIAG